MWECGNVDSPQPCLGVCVWRNVGWVNAALYTAEYERCSDDLRVAPALTMVLIRVLSVTPRAGHCADTWKASQSQALIALGSRSS